MKKIRIVSLSFAFSLLATFALSEGQPAKAGGTGASAKEPLKVFILAGQSNMVGLAAATTLPHIGMDPKTAPMLEKMLGADGNRGTYKSASAVGFRLEGMVE